MLNLVFTQLERLRQDLNQAADLLTDISTNTTLDSTVIKREMENVCK